MPHIKTFSELEEYLHDLNHEHGCDHTAITANGILYSAFCTDPDGAWMLETGDPRERMEYLDAYSEATYAPLELDHLKDSGPFDILFVPGKDTSAPDLESAAGRVTEFLRQWKMGSSNDRGLIYTAAMDVSSPRADLLAADLLALLEASAAGTAESASGGVER